MKPEEILKLAQGFMESKILHTAAQLDLFTLVARNPLSAKDVAGKIRGDVRAVATLMDALAAMGLLSKKGETYECSNPLLVAGAPGSVLPMVLHMSHLWSRWSRLTDIARGVSAASDGFDLSRDEEEMRAFIGAMHSIGAPLAREIVASINAKDSKALLDIGGGSGTYTIAFLRAYPEMKATIFDLPGVIDMARERLTAEGLDDRVALVPGNYFETELPPGHDLALLSAIIHSNSDRENRELYKKIFRALNPGGRILVRDHVMSPDRTRPKDGAIFAINMLVGTPGGGCYTYEEIEAGLREAGFTKMRLLRPGEHMDAVVEGTK